MSMLQSLACTQSRARKHAAEPMSLHITHIRKYPHLHAHAQAHHHPYHYYHSELAYDCLSKLSGKTRCTLSCKVRCFGFWPFYVYAPITLRSGSTWMGSERRNALLPFDTRPLKESFAVGIRELCKRIRTAHRTRLKESFAAGIRELCKKNSYCTPNTTGGVRPNSVLLFQKLEFAIPHPTSIRC